MDPDGKNGIQVFIGIFLYIFGVPSGNKNVAIGTCNWVEVD